MARAKLKPKMKSLAEKPSTPVNKVQKWYPSISVDGSDFPEMHENYMGKECDLHVRGKVVGVHMNDEQGKTKKRFSIEMRGMKLMNGKKEPPSPKRRGHGIDNLEKAEY